MYSVKKNFVTAFLVVITLLFQSVAFAMPCCYGMSSSTGEAIAKHIQAIQAQAEVSDCGHQMAMPNQQKPHAAVDHEDHQCPMAGLVGFSATPLVIDSDPHSFNLDGKNILSGSYLTLVVAPSPFVIDRPPRHS